MPLPAGTNIGVYEVIGMLGAGGMSAAAIPKLRACESAARRLRQFAVGVGPRRECRKCCPQTAAPPSVIGVQHWDEELKARVPAR